MYKVVNKELGIKACGLADLTGQMVDSFLKGWGDGSKIGTLTLFRDDENQIVLNSDNPNYELYLNLAQTYLRAEKDARKELRENVPKSMRETVEVLEDALKMRHALTEVKRIEQNPVDPDLFGSLIVKEIIKKYGSSGGIGIVASMVFTYGKMQGKREERAKRKK